MCKVVLSNPAAPYCGYSTAQDLPSRRGWADACLQTNQNGPQSGRIPDTSQFRLQQATLPKAQVFQQQHSRICEPADMGQAANRPRPLASLMKKGAQLCGDLMERNPLAVLGVAVQ